jgi:hypothetical protein
MGAVCGRRSTAAERSLIPSWVHVFRVSLGWSAPKLPKVHLPLRVHSGLVASEQLLFQNPRRNDMTFKLLLALAMSAIVLVGCSAKSGSKIPPLYISTSYCPLCGSIKCSHTGRKRIGIWIGGEEEKVENNDGPPPMNGPPVPPPGGTPSP